MSSVRAILISGLVASLVMGMWQMIMEAVLPSGAGFFGPLIAMGATVVRDLQGAANPLPFDLGAFILGAAGHMMNSVILAAIFGLLLGRYVGGWVAGLVIGMVYAVAVFVVMWFVVVPLVDPLMLNVSGVVFFIGHLMWGAALGLLWAAFGQRHQAGSGELAAMPR
ncbi:MAG: hypothetical protein ABI534_10750 [Chloroflexota bacterium]